MKHIVTIALLFTAVVFSSCTNYGKKTEKGPVEIYYKEGISETQASRTATILADIDKAQNNNSKEKRSMQLVAVNDTVLFRMVANKDKLASVDDMAFQAIGTIISDSVFAGKPVAVELTDNTFKTFKKIPYKKLDLNSPAE